jgi:hypothetical protein
MSISKLWESLGVSEISQEKLVAKNGGGSQQQITP